ncbi:hypothetical protein M406DRAFT_350878 [Cryphonectria parasitica EP155]|uniref:Uncharacterized protein n=1 Tax=Cryphonectria parasitica (strain ATCC 38755 / EP155) TaxID=660469 RepID=A0A9P4Y7S1_CRYP1|nr:uncharacterized protein M406DRAFT_350878 [Cryphonectria parasitica EP155]KAF3768040.1 hypothetical protein M406DRAFT_350878 [Cryphonectria parasitica EP155]
MALGLGRKTRLTITITISLCFFVAEITVAFKTSSLALLADAFHYLNDLVSFVVALTAQIISERAEARQDLSFGWQRARLLGAFFNGVFLLALGISILLQSIQRFIKVEVIEDPKLVLIIGCVGLGLNVLSAAFVHVDSASNDSLHRHNVAQLKRPGRDLGMLGVLVHVVGDAINNIGVIVAAVIIWQTSDPRRFYADPAASTFIAFMIFFGAIPLTRNSGNILLQSAPRGVEIDDVKHDLEQIPGIESVHELHIWRLDQQKAIASAHVVVSDPSMDSFLEKARTVNECLHAYGIHSATLQPETLTTRTTRTTVTVSDNVSENDSGSGSTGSSLRRRRLDPESCQIVCGSLCQDLMCCTKIEPS